MHVMRRIVGVFAAVALASAPAASPAAGASSFTVVNSTGLDITSISIRRFGSQDWKPLSAAPAVGKPAPIQFSDPDCAFEIRATLSGGQSAVWSGVNLCGTKIVRLNRNASGVLWVDYD